MSFRAVPLPPGVAGALRLAAMPGRLQPWPLFVAEAQRARLTRIVCLTPRHEMASLSPAYHAAVAGGTLPCRWSLLPMRNFGLALDEPAFRDGIVELAEALRGGESVLLHCAAGVGRTGTAAACLLKSLGLPSQQAVQQVRAAGSNPETALQSGLIERF